MVNSRFMIFLLMAALGLSFIGCSQGQSPEPAQSVVEETGETVADGTSPSKRLVRWWRDEAIVAEIGLTDDQIEAIKELTVSTTGDSGEQRRRERHLGLRYLRALSQESYDPAVVDHLGTRLIEGLATEHRRRVENVRALRDILTHEQFTKLWELAPRAVQVGRFVATRGKTISVTGGDPTPPPALAP